MPWGRMGFRRHERGASLPANPYFFVVEHHVGWANRSTGTDGVVLHRPQTLVSSSPGTTSHRLIRTRGRTAWCFTACKPLFLRHRAPRSLTESGFEAGRRGSSPPVNPCFFVVEHHVPDFLQPDNSGNPPRVPGIPISPKKRKMSARCCSRSTLPTFPFPLSISRDCPTLHIEGTVSILSYPILSYPNPLLCSALLNFPKNKNGAEDEIRTRDPRLGKAMLYP